MYGWIGKLLRVNLSTGKISKEALDPAVAKDYLGARGLGTKIMVDEVDPKVDPLSPENKLIFVPGPLTGTFAPSAGRYTVVTKGALTGAIAVGELGRHLGAGTEVRRLRCRDLRGRGAEAGLSVDQGPDGRNSRRLAYLGQGCVPDTSDAIRAETDDDAKVACIGPAGENQVLFACIMNDLHRAAGRSGMGAVMGSKNLKAVAVVGTGAVTCADPKTFERAVMTARDMIQKHPVGGTGLRLYGTDVLTNILNSIGAYPTQELPGRALPDRRQARWRDPERDTAATAERLLLLHHLVWPRHQGHQPEIRGRGRRPRIRNRLGIWRRLHDRRSRCGHQGQLHLQRIWPGHHHHGRHRRLCDGTVRQGSASPGRTPAALPSNGATPRPWSRRRG